MKEKIIEWFIEDIKENIAWSDVDISDDRILQIATNKANDLISKCFGLEEDDES